jgi:hypothetical protein
MFAHTCMHVCACALCACVRTVHAHTCMCAHACRACLTNADADAEADAHSELAEPGAKVLYIGLDLEHTERWSHAETVHRFAWARP